MKTKGQDNLVDRLIDYENNNLDAWETLLLFAQLIKSGQCWTLQGHYGKMAKGMINRGLISSKGKIYTTKYELYKD